MQNKVFLKGQRRKFLMDEEAEEARGTNIDRSGEVKECSMRKCKSAKGTTLER